MYSLFVDEVMTVTPSKQKINRPITSIDTTSASYSWQITRHHCLESKDQGEKHKGLLELTEKGRSHGHMPYHRYRLYHKESIINYIP